MVATDRADGGAVVLPVKDAEDVAFEGVPMSGGQTKRKRAFFLSGDDVFVLLPLARSERAGSTVGTRAGM